MAVNRVLSTRLVDSVPEPDHKQKMLDRNNAIDFAKFVLGSQDYVILDTETTGLRDIDEVIQLAIISNTGEVLLDTLINCQMASIPEGSTAIHGLTKAHLVDAPLFASVLESALPFLAGKTIVTYNADFDRRIIAQSCRINGITDLPALTYKCAMLAYGQYRGVWDERFDHYKWHRLDGGDHSALGDCLATLRLIRTIADSEYGALDFELTAEGYGDNLNL
ncbi:MAG: 3'-5' exonuclease [Candidatus Obscuribacter sp.]|nr:3'-5' exonuclease [Candidatus Obscuribacter sp.]